MPGYMSALYLESDLLANTHHWTNIRMRHGVKLLVLELVTRVNVDVSAPVFCRVAIARSRENYSVKKSVVNRRVAGYLNNIPVIQRPSCCTS